MAEYVTASWRSVAYGSRWRLPTFALVLHDVAIFFAERLCACRDGPSESDSSFDLGGEGRTEQGGQAKVSQPASLLKLLAPALKPACACGGGPSSTHRCSLSDVTGNNTYRATIARCLRPAPLAARGSTGPSGSPALQVCAATSATDPRALAPESGLTDLWLGCIGKERHPSCRRPSATCAFCPRPRRNCRRLRSARRACSWP